MYDRCVVATTAGWLSRMNDIGNLEPLMSAVRRGVWVRIVTEVTPENAKYAKNHHTGFEIRHHPGVNRMVRMMICDSSQVQFALSENDTEVEGLFSLTLTASP